LRITLSKISSFQDLAGTPQTRDEKSERLAFTMLPCHVSYSSTSLFIWLVSLLCSVALFQMDEFEAAEEALRAGAALQEEGSMATHFRTWLRKCKAELEGG
jgi:hypothetical protein